MGPRREEEEEENLDKNWKKGSYSNINTFEYMAHYNNNTVITNKRQLTQDPGIQTPENQARIPHIG